MFDQRWWKRLRDRGAVAQRHPWLPGWAVNFAVWAGEQQQQRMRPPDNGSEGSSAARAIDAIPSRFRNTGLLNTSYLVLPDHCSKPSLRGQRSIFFDVGCAGPQSGVMGGFSITAFANMYARGCIAFDRIYAWERSWQDPEAWWEGVPADLRAKTTFFNFGVEREPSANRSSASVLHLLREVARPEDFVAIKVDIDAAPIELSIVRQIADDPSLARLIDELFFEYHFQFDKGTFLDFLWGPGTET
eukprot:4512672-Prymnesium_polylepis.1